jgi:hypothetical protein
MNHIPAQGKQIFIILFIENTHTPEIMRTLVLLTIAALFASMPMKAQNASFAKEMTFASADVGNDFITDLKVYPNPSTNGYFNINFTNLSRESAVNIKIYNLIGKEVYSERIPSGQDYDSTIRLNELPRGVYILEITNGAQKQTKRLSFI